MILAILQARMGSTRLPSKVMKPILGQPMLSRQIERLKRSKRIDRLVVATSTDASDDALAAACPSWDVECVRGSVDDVLSRFIAALHKFPADTVVRLTGDCPLADPEVIDAVIDHYRAGDYDYVSNVNPDTFPDGLDCEVMRASALEQAQRNAVHPSSREHVTPYIRLNPDIFRIGNYAGKVDLSHLRWTVDEPSDFEFVREVYERLYPANPAFTTADILKLLDEKPELLQINAGLIRNVKLKLPESGKTA